MKKASILFSKGSFCHTMGTGLIEDKVYVREMYRPNVILHLGGTFLSRTLKYSLHVKQITSLHLKYLSVVLSTMHVVVYKIQVNAEAKLSVPNQLKFIYIHCPFTKYLN